jgi:chemotaxis protein histidine kinase CheA
MDKVFTNKQIEHHSLKFYSLTIHPLKMETTLKSFEKVLKTYGEGIAKTLSSKYGFDLTEAIEFIQTDIQKPKKEKKQPKAKKTDGEEPKKRGRKPKEPSSPSTSGDESTEKTKKKVGRPKKDNTGEVNANAGDDLIARLVAEAKAETKSTEAEEAQLVRDDVFATSNTDNASVNTKKDIAAEANSDVEETANKIIGGNAPRKSKSKKTTCVDDAPKTNKPAKADKPAKVDKPAKADKPKKKTKKEIADEAKAAAELAAKAKKDEEPIKLSLEEQFEEAKANAEAEAKANAEAEAKANAEAEAKANAEAEAKANAEAEANEDSELEEEDADDESEQDDDIEVREFIHDGEKYLKTDDGVLYDLIEGNPIGTWNEETQSISFIENND